MHPNKNRSELASARLGFREQLAHHLAGGGQESNWSLIVSAAVAIEEQDQIRCSSCDGDGAAPLSTERLSAFQARISDLNEECRRAVSVGDLALERRIGEKIQSERWKLNRDAVCKACRGSGWRGTDGKPAKVRHDSTWTTVSCPTCRGRDARRNDLLLETHRGASSGTIRTFDADDHERIDPCADCMDENGVGTGYRVPITARPVSKGGEIDAYVEAIDDVPVFYRETESADPLDVLERLTERNPKLAAAVTILVSPIGDEWAQHQWGRRFALWPVTPAGESLLAELDGEHTTHEQKLAALAVVNSAVESGGGKPRERAFAAMADRQARHIENMAEREIRAAEAAA